MTHLGECAFLQGKVDSCDGAFVLLHSWPTLAVTTNMLNPFSEAAKPPAGCTGARSWWSGCRGCSGLWYQLPGDPLATQAELQLYEDLQGICLSRISKMKTAELDTAAGTSAGEVAGDDLVRC